MDIVDKDFFGRAACSGAFAGGATRMFYGSGLSADYMGRPVPLYAVGGVCGAGASMLSDGVHRFVLPHISNELKLDDAAGVGLAAGSGALGMIGLVNMADQLWGYKLCPRTRNPQVRVCEPACAN